MSIGIQSAAGGRDNGDRRSLQLLIVDDDAVQRMLIAAAAKQAGHAVTLAQSCSEAITQIQAARFDCVTLDLMLGDFEPEDFASGHGLRLKIQFQLVPLHRKRNVSLQDSLFPNMPVHRSFKETRCEPARQRPTTISRKVLLPKPVASRLTRRS